MAGRGKVPIYMISFVMTFGLLGFISFQALKERKNTTILLVAKYKEIDELNNQYEELWEASKKNLAQAKKEKDDLIHKIFDLENSKKLHQAMCKEDKEKYKIKKDQEITILKEKLQAKDIELTKTRAKIEIFKLGNKKVNDGMVIKTIVKEHQESLVKPKDKKDSNLEVPISLDVANDKKIDHVGIVDEESNIVGEAKVEHANTKVGSEADEVNKASPIESDITVEEEDDAKEFEVDIEVRDFNTRESDKSQIQE